MEAMGRGTATETRFQEDESTRAGEKVAVTVLFPVIVMVVGLVVPKRSPDQPVKV
jgi:hypothetical protein